MTAPATRRSVVNRYNKAPKAVRDYFRHVPELVEEFPLGVSLAWMFAKVEIAWNMTIYSGVVKIHRANARLTRVAVNRHHMSRESFWTLFETVYGRPVKKSIRNRIEEALEVRDKLMHGKSVTEAEKRKAVVDIVQFAEEFNDFVHGIAGIRPFGDLRGFKGRARALDKSTTRWLLKGIGLTVS